MFKEINDAVSWYGTWRMFSIRMPWKYNLIFFSFRYCKAIKNVPCTVKSTSSSWVTKLLELSEKNEVHLGLFKNIGLVWLWNCEAVCLCVYLEERQDGGPEKRIQGGQQWELQYKWSIAGQKAEERMAQYREIKAG